MNRLLDIGFQRVGKWTLHNNALALELERMSAQRNVLYAFVMNDSVLYVGKTASTFKARLGGYLRPTSTQRTNVRNNLALIELLQQNNLVEIYVWPDSGLHKVGPFHLNYAAGLEDSIIKTLAPPWNGARSNPQLTNLLPTSPSPNILDGRALSDMESVANNSEAASDAEVIEMEASGALAAAPSFQIKLGKTYYKSGFFNVPVKYSSLFPEHGTEISIYCGEARTLIRAVVDRNSNQNSGTPRIYGKSPLIAWFSCNRKLDDDVSILVISCFEIELS